jgi:hypothetical protein
VSTLQAGVGRVINALGGSSGTDGGNRSYYRGLPLMLRNSRYATVHTKSNRAVQAMPRQKFLFYATFNPGPSIGSIRNFSTWQSGFAFQIKEIDRPKASPVLRELNQYNRRRVVHTGIKFDPVNIQFHDTVDDRVLRVWRDYYKWFFGEGRGKSTAIWNESVIVPRENMGLSNGWGFAPPDTVKNTNFFSSLDVYTFYGKKFSQVRMYNPKITTINFDTLETTSSEMLGVQMTVEHEGHEYVEMAAPLTAKQVELFNLNAGDYFEPEDAFGGVNAFLMDLNDNLEQSIDSILGGVRNIPFVGGVLAGLGNNAVRASGVTGILPRAARGLASSTLNRWGRF